MILKMIKGVLSMIPNPTDHINLIHEYIRLNKQFIFIRFSDGEIDILRNRKLIIKDGNLHERGLEYNFNYPKWDEKTFIPNLHQDFRKDLLESALFRADNYFKGIPTAHNKAIIDREFMLRLNGGFHKNMTFSDLFLNSNFGLFREKTINLFKKKKVCLISNWRSELPIGFDIIKQIKLVDNFIPNYREILNEIMIQIEALPENTLILCSASSLTNILGFKTYKLRKDLSLFDIGTSMNDLLGIPMVDREYHVLISNNIKKINKYKKTKGYKFKW